MTSWLFTPAHQSRLTARAHERGADVVLLDLEDSVQVADKPAARAGLAEVVNCLAAHGARVAVRVNAGLSDLARDVEAAALSGVEALMLLKVVDPGVLRLVAARMAPHQDLIALIETAEGLMNAAEIARTPRVKAIAFGTEDFSADLGISPTVETLSAPAQSLILAARAAGIEALGLPASIADIADAEAFERHVQLGQRLGFDGVLCVHPSQVAIVNRVYPPSEAALIAARRLVAAYDAAGEGAILLDGKMIDPPVVARALRLLRRNQGHKARA